MGEMKTLLPEEPKPAPALSATEERMQLLSRAQRGDISVLSHPDVATMGYRAQRTPLHELASAGILAVLGHPKVAEVRDLDGWTPLHNLALAGKVEVLKHPQATEVKSELLMETPLHGLARAGKNDAVLQHPLADSLKNAFGETPKDLLEIRQRLVAATTRSKGTKRTDLDFEP